jgi:maltose/moltooligosaccharide transporter
MRPFQQQLNTVFLSVLSLPCTAMGFALSVQIAALSWIMSEKYGLAIHDVGLVWAAGPIAGILGQPIVGLISDKVWFWGGRRKPFIWIGGVLTALALLALPNIDLIASGLGLEGILGVAMLVTLVLDLSINISFNPTRSLIADVTPDDHRRTRAFTWMQAISGTFGVLAYLLGITAGNIALIYIGSALVLLFSLLPPLLIEEPRELNAGADAAADAASPPASALQIFGTLRPLAGFLLYAVYQFVREVMHRSGGGGAEHGAAEAAAESASAAAVSEPGLAAAVSAYGVEIAALALTALLLVDTFRRPDSEAAGTGAFRKILAAHAFTWLGIQTMFVFMFAWLRQHFPDTDERQLGQQIGWSFFTLNAVAAVLPALVLEPLARSIPRIALHRACIASMSLGFLLLLYFGQSPLAIYVIMGLLGVGWASTISLVFAIMSNKARGERMGLFMGLFNLSVVLPQLTVSLGIGRLVSEAPNKDIIFWIAAGALGVSALLWGLIPKGKVE